MMGLGSGAHRLLHMVVTSRQERDVPHEAAARGYSSTFSLT